MTPYSNPKGVGGWLTLLIVGLIILGPLLGFVRIGADFLRIEDTSPSLRSNADWQALKEATWTLFLVCAGFSIAAGYRLWRYHDSSSVKFAIISLWGLPVAFVVGQLLIIDWLYPSHMLTDDIAKSLFQLFGSFIGAGIWTLYFVKSARVRNTYSFTYGTMFDTEKVLPKNSIRDGMTGIKNEPARSHISDVEDKNTLAPSDFDVEDDFEKLLRYSSKIEAIYSAISKLPRSLKRKFREGLYKSKDPISDAERLAKSLLAEYSKSLNPFNSEEANRCYRLCVNRRRTWPLEVTVTTHCSE